MNTNFNLVDVRESLLNYPDADYDMIFDALHEYAINDALPSAVIAYSIAGGFYSDKDHKKISKIAKTYISAIMNKYDNMDSKRQSYCDNLFRLIDSLPKFLNTLPKSKMLDVFEYSRRQTILSPILIKINPFWAIKDIPEISLKVIVRFLDEKKEIDGDFETYVTFRDAADDSLFNSDDVLVSASYGEKVYRGLYGFKYSGHMFMLLILNCNIKLTYYADCDYINMSWCPINKMSVFYFHTLDALRQGCEFPYGLTCSSSKEPVSDGLFGDDED